MSRNQWIDIALKGALAAGFFFTLKYVILNAPFEMSLVWGVSLGIAACLLAYSQHKRGL